MYTYVRMLKKIEKFLLHHELLVMILCLVAILRLPTLLEPYWYGDEGIYLTLGTGIRHGLALYRDIHDNKPPVVYLLAAISGSQFWFRLILMGWNLTSIAVFSWIATHILNPEKREKFKKFGKHLFPVPSLATFATLLFALLPFAAEGNIANGEIFMILPTIIGFALLLRLRDEKKTKTRLQLSALAGISFSLAFLTKVPAVFDAIAAGIFFFVIPTGTVTSIKKRAQHIIRSIFSLPPWVFGAAFIIPILLSIAYYSAIGAGQPYIKAALLQNVGYLSSWKTGSQSASNVGQSGLKNRAAVVAVVTAALLVASPYITGEAILVLIWFAFALFGALLSERPYPHYLIQIIPALALIIPLFLKTVFELRKKLPSRIESIRRTTALIGLGACVAALVVSFVVIKFWNYAIPPYYQNYIQFVTGKINRDQYFSFFDKTLTEQYGIANIIASGTTPNDRIFIWGDLPNIYALTRRLPPGRYTSAYHVKDFQGFDETLAAIYKTSPKYMLVDNRIEKFPHLDPLLSEEYVVSYSSPLFTLYRKRNTNN